MGFSKSKQTTKSNSTESGTARPIIPQHIDESQRDMVGRIRGFLAKPADSFIAGSSPLQDQAFAGAGNLGAWQAPMQAATAMAQNAGGAPASTYSAPTLNAPGQVNLAGYGAPQLDPAAHARYESLLKNLPSYMSPYTDSVVNTTLANYDRETGQDAAALQAQGARGRAFGGSRFGLAQGEFDAVSNMNRAGTEAGLRDNAFRFGAQLSDQDASRRQSVNFFNAGADNTRALTQGQFNENAARFGADAANTGSMFNTDAVNRFDLARVGLEENANQFNAQSQEAAMQRALQAAGITANIGSDIASNERADVGMAADVGGIQRMIEQAKLSGDPAQLQLAGDLYARMNLPSYFGNQFSGTSSGTNVTKDKPSLFSQWSDLAGKVASAVAAGSDRRLKRDIEPTGGSHGKLKLYEFNYHWDAPDRPKRTGVMADEVAIHSPEALGPLIEGYATVNYEALGLAHMVEA